MILLAVSVLSVALASVAAFILSVFVALPLLSMAWVRYTSWNWVRTAFDTADIELVSANATFYGISIENGQRIMGGSGALVVTRSLVGVFVVGPRREFNIRLVDLIRVDATNDLWGVGDFAKMLRLTFSEGGKTCVGLWRTDNVDAWVDLLRQKLRAARGT